MAETLTIPPAVDLHVHFRQPGTNPSETFESGSRAGLLGGYGALFEMPNTPGAPTWSEGRLVEKELIVMEQAYLPMGLYAGSQPESDNLGELAAMSKHAMGLKLYSAPTTGNPNDYYAADFRDQVRIWHEAAPYKPIMFHAGQGNLEGMIDMVAREYNHPLHVCHVSNMVQVVAVNHAKDRGLPVTAGVTPHHLFLNSQDAHRMGAFGHMQPPLEHQDESEQLFEALLDGDIDIIETDHAPHPSETKMEVSKDNPDGLHDAEHRTCFGVPNIEFAMPLLLREMKLGRISTDRLIEVTSTTPARIAGLRIARDTKVTWDMVDYRIDTEFDYVQSKAGWTPFLGSLAVGEVNELTIGGVTYVEAGAIVEPRRPGRVLSSRYEEL